MVFLEIGGRGVAAGRDRIRLFPCVGRNGTPMKNPFDSLWGTVACGLLLTAVLYALVRSLMLP
jgi:hypothetical protein